MKIINIGRFPPPIGGVSYFLKRLKPYLDESKIENIFFDISGHNYEKENKYHIKTASPIKCFKELMFYEKSVVIFHANRTPILLAAYILSFKHKIVFFAHGESILKKSKLNLIFKLVLNRASHIVAPTDLIFSELNRSYPKYKKKFKNIPFILFPKIIKPFNEKRFNQLKNKTDYLLAGYAYDLSVYNGEDLYGVDMMIELVKRLNTEKIKVGLVLILPKNSNKEKLNKLLTEINRDGLKELVLIIQNPIEEATDLYSAVDVYLRPTNTDGDSFSVWEALYTNTPVIASDVSQRPDSCIIFKSRNINDFLMKTKYVLQNIDQLRNKLKQKKISGSEELLKNFLIEISKKK